MKGYEQVYKLFKALDDIDTTSDIYKGSHKARCEHIDKIIKDLEYDSKFRDWLFDRFYNKEEDILTPIFNGDTNE